MSEPTDPEHILLKLQLATREARECLKDFKQMQRDWAQLREETAGEINRLIGEEVRKGLERYQEALNQAIKLATDKVFARFDKITAMILGEDKKHQETIPDLIQARYTKD